MSTVKDFVAVMSHVQDDLIDQRTLSDVEKRLDPSLGQFDKSKKYFHLKISNEKIRLMPKNQEFRNYLYIDISESPVEDTETSLKLDLFLGNVLIKFEDDEESRSLGPGAIIEKLDAAWACSAEVKNCRFICEEEDSYPYPLTLSFGNFRKVHFIGNKSPVLAMKLIVYSARNFFAEDPIYISKNIFSRLIIEYGSPAPAHEKYAVEKLSKGRYPSRIYSRASYLKGLTRRITIRNNKISDYLRINIRKVAFKQRIEFLFRKNRAGILSLGYGPNFSRDVAPDPVKDILSYQGLENIIQGRHILNMNRGNTIKIIHIEGKYPIVTNFGVEEKIGTGILKEARVGILARILNAWRIVSGSYTEVDKARSIERGNAIAKIEVNRYILRFFKDIAINEKRRILEQAMNYHLTIFDGMLLKIDKWLGQDRLISAAGWYLSKHGTSWFLPILWVGVVGALCAFMITDVLRSDVGIEMVPYSTVLFELSSPLGSPNKILDSIGITVKELSNHTVLIFGFSFFFFKAFYVISIYMFYRAATRFTLKPKN